VSRQRKFYASSRGLRGRKGSPANPPLAGSRTVKMKPAGFQAVLEGVGPNGKSKRLREKEHILRPANRAGIRRSCGLRGVRGLGGGSRTQGERRGAGIVRGAAGDLRSGRGVDRQFVMFDAHFDSPPSLHVRSVPCSSGPCTHECAPACGSPTGLLLWERILQGDRDAHRLGGAKAKTQAGAGNSVAESPPCGPSSLAVGDSGDVFDLARKRLLHSGRGNVFKLAINSSQFFLNRISH
jgi:hypothetical protein